MKSIEDQLKRCEKELENVREMIKFNKDDDKLLFDLYKQEAELSLEVENVKRWIKFGHIL